MKLTNQYVVSQICNPKSVYAKEINAQVGDVLEITMDVRNYLFATVTNTRTGDRKDVRVRALGNYSTDVYNPKHQFHQPLYLTEIEPKPEPESESILF